MAPWLYRCEAAETIYAFDENVIGPRRRLAASTMRSVGGQTRGLAKWLQSVSARSVVGKTIRSLSRSVVSQTSFEASQSQGQASPTSSREKEGSAEGTCSV